MPNDTHKKEAENFVHNVTWLRKQYGFSKKHMAKILGISVKSLNRIENGELPSGLNIALLRNIYDFFKIEPETLIKQRLEN